MTQRIWHFTCSCNAEKIERDGYLNPNPYAFPRLVWMTDLDSPDITGLGLTRHIVTCDRTAHRFEVDPTSVLPWGRLRNAVPRLVRDRLELAPGATPRHWYVSAHRVPLLGRELPAPPRTLTTTMDLDLPEPWDWDALNDITP